MEKEEGVEGGVLERLETGAHTVCVEGDWRAAVDPEVTADLRKYRTYRGDSVRDLLRALRNKVGQNRLDILLVLYFCFCNNFFYMYTANKVIYVFIL